MPYVLATANPDKAREIVAVLPGFDLELRPQDIPDVDETGDTLEDNARLKADAIVAATGKPAIADDTGLEVAALGGKPGVHTARFAGPNATYAENVRKLLADLEGVSDRRARFVTVAVAKFPDGREIVTTGAVDGTIATEARGLGGFGYDPVFVADEGDGRTFAEMGNEKHDISHRGRAFRALADELTNVDVKNP